MRGSPGPGLGWVPGIWVRVADYGDRGRAASATVRTVRASRRASDVLPATRQAQAFDAVSLRQIAQALNAKGIPAPRGGERYAATVQRVLGRMTA